MKGVGVERWCDTTTYQHTRTHTPLPLQCAACSPGFHLDVLSRKCLDCEETHVSPAVMVGIVLLITVTIAACVSWERLERLIKRLDLGKLRIVIFANLQIVRYVYKVFKVLIQCSSLDTSDELHSL